MLRSSKSKSYMALLERNKNLRAERRAAGACTVCGELLEPGSSYVMCSKCRKYMNLYRKNVKETEEHYEKRLSVNRKRMVKLYYDRKNNHACVGCGAPLDKSWGKIKCPECNEKSNAYHREYYRGTRCGRG